MKEINEKTLKEIYFNILKAIIVMLYFFILNISYENTDSRNFLILTKTLTMIFLFITIIIFEIAYKKDSDKLAVQGIEFLILSVYTLTTEHIITKFNFYFKSYSLVASYLFASYFILRCIIVYTKEKKEIVNNLSDIREIVQKEKPIKKEAKKKSIKEDIDKEENKEEVKIND